MTILEKILSVTKLQEDGCRVFFGFKDKDGYGITKYQGQNYRVHRLAWEGFVGPIPTDKYVLHACDNRACCAREHLFLGTQQDNVDDMIRKGRQKFDNYANAKLDVRSVEEIRSMLKSGRSQQSIADLFGLNQSAVSDIKTGRAWSNT